jgi:hypothetical protein
MNNLKRCWGSTHALGWFRCLLEDWTRRPIGRKAKRRKRPVGPNIEVWKTKTFVEIEGFERNSDGGISGSNNNISHVGAPDD